MIRVVAPCGSGVARERREQRRTLLGAQAPDAAVSLMPISSIVRRALTLPTPGSDSSTAKTFILPTMSSFSALRERARTS